MSEQASAPFPSTGHALSAAGAEPRPGAKVWTIAQVLAWVSQDLASRSFSTPRLEAELLLAHVLGCSRVELILERDRELSPQHLAAYRGLVLRRRLHEPVAYLCGVREFFGLPFGVDKRVLVPRPDTETLVETALDVSGRDFLGGRMLDLCTGSGNVALAFAKHRRTWRITATDISPGALEVAKANATRLDLALNTRLRVSDLFSALGEERFDLITSNPPYIPTGEIPTLDADVHRFEPHLALDGGPDGLRIIERLVAQAVARLTRRGVLALEVGFGQAQGVATLMSRAGFRSVSIRRDLGQRDRVVCGRLG